MILTIFSFGLLLNFFAIKYLSNFYALDFPNYRKKHANPTPLIGGIIFSLLSLIVITTFVDKVPNWFIYGGLVSILLGAIDDNFNISWLVKLFVQLVLAIYLTYLFWGKFSHLSFYGYEIAASQPILFIFTKPCYHIFDLVYWNL